MEKNDDQKWKEEFALKEQEFLLNRACPSFVGSGYTLQVLDGGRLRAFRSYPSRNATRKPNKNGNR